MRTLITYEQLDALIRFADEIQTSIDLDAVRALNELNAAVQSNVIKELTGARKRNAMLKERLERRRTERRERLETGEFDESGLDSAEVAEALTYQLQQLKTYRLNSYKVTAILYEMYASWLYSKGERLCVEHPLANEYGPRFWHAIKRIDPNTPVPYERWKEFAEKRPDIAAFTKNAAFKYYDIAESTLRNTFIKTKAFENAAPPNNGGKWNGEIRDADIYRWKKAQSQKKQ